jgi:hypothetical protein
MTDSSIKVPALSVTHLLVPIIDSLEIIIYLFGGAVSSSAAIIAQRANNPLLV